MNLNAFDGLIVFVFLAVTIVMGWRTRRYTRSVVDFLAAGRSAGRYLIAVGDGMAGFGAITMVAYFQMYYEGGFTPLWWQSILMTTGMLTAITGWVIYRFRQTRALTMAQFFEMRYSRRFRVFAGVIAFLSGVVNFGIFPAVSVRFLIYFTGLPPTFIVAGVPCSTFAVLMALLLAMAVWFTLIGGQISVLVTDYLQAVFCNVVFVVVLVYLIGRFGLTRMIEPILEAPAGKSMINPYRIGNLENYNTVYYLIWMFQMWYGCCSWQGQQGFNSAARDPHEARMSKILGLLRQMVPVLFAVLLPVCAWTVMHDPEFHQQAVRAGQVLSGIASEQVRSQMTVPVALVQILPAGIMGLFCAVILATFIGTHDTYLHSWGSIFMQDIVLPLRRRPLTPRQHMNCLRLAILGVAVFSYFFSLFFTQNCDIFMFFWLSGMIFLGGSGAVIIGGLYWKRGTTAGAYAAMVTSLLMAAFGFAADQRWPQLSGALQRHFPRAWDAAGDLFPALNTEKFFLTQQELFFFAMVICGLVYVTVSLASFRPAFNLDRLLHRGPFAIAGDAEAGPSRIHTWKTALGFSDDLTRDDKLVFIAAYAYLLFFFAVFVIGTVYNMFFGLTDGFFLAYWRIYCWVLLALTIVIGGWMTVGGMRDLKAMFRILDTAKRDASDNGAVHQAQEAVNRMPDPLPGSTRPTAGSGPAQTDP